MENDYVQQLDEWIKAKGVRKPDGNVAAFLAVRDLVKARLDDGYSATIIFAYLHEKQRIDVCYDTFLKYVHRYVQPPRKGPKAKNRARTQGQPRTQASAKVTESDAPPPKSGFTFNPFVKREDLI